MTMLSPVWIPMGSKFSILQTVMQLSARSRDDFVFDFLPAFEILLDENLLGFGESPGEGFAELLRLEGDAASLAAESEGGTGP